MSKYSKRKYGPDFKYDAMARTAAATAGYFLARKRAGASKTQKASASKSKKGSFRTKGGRRYRRKAAISLQSLNSRVNTLAKVAKSDQGTHIQRRRGPIGSVKASVGLTGTSIWDAISLTLIEEVLAQLRYYDPAAPTNLVQASGLTGTYSKFFMFESIVSSIHLRNNYQVPAEVRVYACRVKSDTNITPLGAFQNGLADVGNPSNTSPLVYITDSIQFNELWTIEKSMVKRLEPGQECSMRNITKSFRYDPSVQDSHNQEYQKNFKGLSYFVRVVGIVGHDSAVTTEYTTLQAGVDAYVDTTFTVGYSAGADIKYIHIDNESSASFTNGGLVSLKPVADNIGYSIS